jgi:glutaredoxin
MDPLARRILEIFRDHQAGAPDLAGIGGLLASEAPARLEAAIAELTSKGWLRFRKGVEGLALAEEGRLALAGPLDVTLYTRPGCHLCEEAKAVMEPLLREFGARLREVSIDEDAELKRRYSAEVPVIFLGARKAAKHRVEARQFRRQLESAARAS